MTNRDGDNINDLFFSVIFGNVELEKETLNPFRDLTFRIDVEKCTDIIAKEGIESFRKLLIENFKAHVDSFIDGNLLP